MRKKYVDELVRNAIRDDALPYELKNEMWNHIERNVAGMRAPKRNRSFHQMQTTFAWIGSVAIAVCLALVGHYVIQEHSTSTSANKGNNTSNVTHHLSPISEHSYASSVEAFNAIASLEQTFGQFYPSGLPVNLGYGIHAEFSGGAGQYSYKWTEGRWTVLTRFWGSNTAGTQVARGMVSYLHTHMLPVPETKGVVIISQASSSTTPKMTQNTIAWQVGNKVFELKVTGDSIHALEAVVNSTSQNPRGGM
ncbi:hypothetical protein JI721_03175 [Alicyclobacillus cycloheptanicus]|uniref:DUF4367 domain-containing protein n=1 Tax=Alicyclobacillus cycloheptanicus TaxID=1457 RepID=A0ABT9XPB4_9BACL|nr:hypothetical protein [Alicyclobacillus cycloheptanicus]MDQ0191598.1 hypothetical protein [Alicyclobacillus cycloheptanicus]WDM01863.1 hypothetical protein JI721_03175 [Alicyclobacillus cycloheptanicus]